jgi:hypothetical protein
VEAIRLARSTDPKVIQQALWKVDMNASLPLFLKQ